jgi:hypothetical protein
MIRPALALLPLALLSACADPAPGEGGQLASEQVWCAVDGAKGFTQDCSLERGSEAGSGTFVVRHPGGKFRRLIASPDGQNLLAADGADQSQSARKGDRWEVILGDDRYVIPVKANALRR